MKRLLKKTLWGYILTYALTFLIVIGLLIPIYSMAYNSSRRVIEQNLTSSLSAGTERLAVAVHAADLYAYSLMEQDEIVNIAYRANIKNSHLINAKQLQKKLIDPFSTSATLIKDVVVLFINSDYVISKGIVQTRDKYWGNLIGIRGMTQAQFESQLLERREQFFPLSTIQTVHMSISSPAICLNYFSKTRLKPYYAICAIIPESSIRDIVYDETVAQHGWMKITDAHGRVVSFEHTIIVMTSNAGSNLKGSGTAGFNKSVSLLNEEKSKKALGEFLRPEFLNRVDEIITFDPLPRELFGSIVRIFLSDLADGLREREIEFQCTDAAVEKLADMSYSSEYGARNVRRVVQREIEDKVVSDMCDADMIPKKVTVDVKDGELTVVAE